MINHKYENYCIFAMDETAYWMDMPFDTTVAITGSHSIPLKTSSHEKTILLLFLLLKLMEPSLGHLLCLN